MICVALFCCTFSVWFCTFTMYITKYKIFGISNKFKYPGSFVLKCCDSHNKIDMASIKIIIGCILMYDHSDI